jgi:hypothetical protein
MGEGSRGRRRALLAVLVVLALVGCTGTAPPDRGDLCQPCADGIGLAYGPNVTVGETDLVIALGDRGDSEWTVTASVSGDGLGAYRGDEAAVEEAGAAAIDGVVSDYPRPPALHERRTTRRSAELENGTLELAFGVTDVGHETRWNVRLYDAFHTRGAEPGAWHVRSDTLTVVAPDGYHFVSPPAGATVRNRSAIQWQAGDWIAGDTYLQAVPDGYGDGTPWRQVAVAADVVGWTAPRVLLHGAVGASIVALVFLRRALVSRRSTADSWLESTAAALPSRRATRAVRFGWALGATLVAGALLLAPGASILSALAWLAVGVSGFVSGFVLLEHDSEVGAFPTVVTVLLPFAVAAAVIAPGGDPGAELWLTGGFALAVVLLGSVAVGVFQGVQDIGEYTRRLRAD